MGVLTPNRTLSEWRLVFIISCAFLVATNLVYIIWASAETQPWNTPVQPKLIENGTENSENESDEKKEQAEKSKDEPKL